jgi:hypothetical protein
MRPARTLTFMAALMAAMLALLMAAPAGAHRHREVQVAVVARPELADGALAAVELWNEGQDVVRLVPVDRCDRGAVCIKVGEVWDAWDGYRLDGIAYGGWSDRIGRRTCAVGLPLVLTHPPLIARFQAALDAAGHSTRGMDTGTWVVRGVAAHEIGHCLGLADQPSGPSVMGPFPDDRLWPVDVAALR